MSVPPDSTEGRSPEDWPDEPDPWEVADREWREKWSHPEEAEAPEASGGTGEGYMPRKSSLGSVTDGYEEGMREAGPFLTIGLQIAMSMLFFVGCGWAVDEWLGSTPWGVLVGTLLGFLGVLGLVIRLASEAEAVRVKRTKGS